MKKVALTVLTILAVAALAAFTWAPKPRVSSLTLSASKLSATTLTVKGCWTTSGGPDGFVTTGTAAGQATQTHTLGVVVCDSFTFTAPAPGLTLTGAFAVVAKRRGLSSASVSKAWTYTEPDLPPPAPVIDSLILRPASFTLVPGATQQVCTLAYWSDKTITNVNNEAAIPLCDQLRAAAAMGA